MSLLDLQPKFITEQYLHKNGWVYYPKNIIFEKTEWWYSIKKDGIVTNLKLVPYYSKMKVWVVGSQRSARVVETTLELELFIEACKNGSINCRY